MENAFDSLSEDGVTTSTFRLQRLEHRNGSLGHPMLSEIAAEEGLPVGITAPCPQPASGNNHNDRHTYVATTASLLRGPLRVRSLQGLWRARSRPPDDRLDFGDATVREESSTAFLARAWSFGDFDDAIDGEESQAFPVRSRSFGNMSDLSTVIMSEDDDGDVHAFHPPSLSASWASLFSDSSLISTSSGSLQIMAVKPPEENQDGLDLTSDLVKNFVLNPPVGPSTNRPQGRFGSLR